MPHHRPPCPDPIALPISLLQPVGWLGRGWNDIARAPVPALLHGLVFMTGALLALLLGRSHFWLLVGSFSGFLLVAPILATGLYAVSQALERGQRPGLQTVLAVWRSGDRRLIGFGLLLALAGTGWVLTSAATITLWSPRVVATPLDFIHHVVLARDHWLFEFWLLLGGLLAAPLFASSVVAIPLLLDRPVSIRQAVLASWRCVLTSPVALAWWACLIMLLSLLGLVLPPVLVLTAPLLAHASWHAYRDLLAPTAAAAQERQP